MPENVLSVTDMPKIYSGGVHAVRGVSFGVFGPGPPSSWTGTTHRLIYNFIFIIFYFYLYPY